jgi:glycosyltransferase involved in cell wall biosynthesis
VPAAVPADVLINARAARRAQISGVERWAQEMTTRLPALRPGAYAVAAPHPRLAHRPGQAWEQIALPARAARTGARLIFSPANTAPLAWPRNVVVVHDAVALSHPEWYSTAYRTWVRVQMRGVRRTAVRVIVPSEFSAAELSELARIDRERVVVVPGAVDERFRPDADPAPARRALGLDRPYVLAPGGTGLRKNLRALSPAAAELAERGIEIVAAGAHRTHVAAAEGLHGVRALGYVPEELLSSLYAGARAVVLPSLHEGFGLPCIEAMASGVPVAASDRGALPETCAGAALHFDPDDPDAVIAATVRIVEDEPLREQLRTAGLARAASLTWARCATAVDAVLAAA